MDFAIFNIIFLFLIGIELELSFCEICVLYSCGKLDDNACLSPVLSSPVKKYILQSCSNVAQQCLFKEEEILEPLHCQPKEKPFYMLYPGAECERDSECQTEQCENGKCKGIPENVQCTLPKQCYYGFTCRKDKEEEMEKKCSTPQLPGGFCEDDTDCSLTYGCLNKKCVQYFSFDDGTTVPYPSLYPHISFCKSGYDYKGTCKTLIRKNSQTKECDEENPCMYLDQNNEEIPIEELCTCGLNPTGKKYCMLGSGDRNYTKYISQVQELFLRNNSNCHLEERGIQCAKDVKHANKTLNEEFQNLTNAKIWALHSQRLINADQCAMSVVFPEYDSSKDPSEDPVKKCGKFSCENNQNFCAFMKYQKGESSSVILSDICMSNEYCFVGNDPRYAFQEKRDVLGACHPISYNFETIRYPGEDCTINVQCANPAYPSDPEIGHCKNNICSGYNETENCLSTDMCWKGLYCSKETHRCEAQKGYQANCDNTYECQNKYICYESKCQSKFYSQPAGTIIKGDINANFYCEYGYSINSQCVALNSTYVPDPTTGLVACEIGTLCNYTTIPIQYGIISKECECGFGIQPQGYCPKSHATDTSLWKKYFRALIKKYDNMCHSLSRFRCYSSSLSVHAEVKYYEHRIERGHLFDQAVDCAEKVLEGSFLSTAIKLGMILVFNIIIVIY